MFTIKEFVPASEIWSSAKNYVDKGYKTGYVRGYNIEVVNLAGETSWLSCSYIHDDPEEYFNNDFHHWLFEHDGYAPTGRICFRGYGVEYYDEDERDTFIEKVEV